MKVLFSCPRIKCDKSHKRGTSGRNIALRFSRCAVFAQKMTRPNRVCCEGRRRLEIDQKRKSVVYERSKRRKYTTDGHGSVADAVRCQLHALSLAQMPHGPSSDEELQ